MDLKAVFGLVLASLLTGMLFAAINMSVVVASGASKRWINMFPSSHPSARAYHGMAYDSENNVVILFGGSDVNGSYLHDTWAYKLSTNEWINMTTPSHPPARNVPLMAYDSDNKVVVMFGGSNGTYSFFDDTWIYSFSTNTWTQKFPTTKPSARSNHPNGMAYDSVSKVMVTFGGYYGYWWLDDTWVYSVSANTWIQKTPLSHPSARTGNNIVYDIDNNIMVIFGGMFAYGTTYDETWTYSVSADTWTQRLPTSHPTARGGHVMDYDTCDHHIVLFGGAQIYGPVFNDTWIYETSSNTWSNITAIVGSSPSPRYSASMVYDSVDNAHILFGGIGSSGFFDDTWVLRIPQGVGGIVIPVDKFGLLAPYIGVASTILVAAVATAVYVKRAKRRKERQ